MVYGTVTVPLSVTAYSIEISFLCSPSQQFHWSWHCMALHWTEKLYYYWTCLYLWMLLYFPSLQWTENWLNNSLSDQEAVQPLFYRHAIHSECSIMILGDLPCQPVIFPTIPDGLMGMCTPCDTVRLHSAPTTIFLLYSRRHDIFFFMRSMLH